MGSAARPVSGLGLCPAGLGLRTSFVASFRALTETLLVERGLRVHTSGQGLCLPRVLQLVRPARTQMPKRQPLNRQLMDEAGT